MENQNLDDVAKEKQSHSNYKISTKDIHVYYGEKHVLKGINLHVKENTVVALIGPSGCGKSTYLRLLNRMNDYITNFRKEGDIIIDGQDIYSKEVTLERLRKNVGMVFQKPNPFPKSIYENVVYGLRIHGVKDKEFLDHIVEKSLKQAALWEEVKDDLKKSALSLSGGQQQRLCIARTLAVEPTVILMDEPASALDPISTSKIEDLIFELKEKYTIMIVTHNMQQAARVSDYTGFFLLGDLVEYGKTKDIFTKPKQEQTKNYIGGKYG